MDFRSSAQIILRAAGFATRLGTVQRFSVVSFEDSTILGFAHEFETPADLLNGWRELEDHLLVQFAPNLRRAGDKAWNVYCVFVCAPNGDEIQNREIGWIEEDLERTRKIAAAGIRSREDAVRALLPLLPLQYESTIRPEDTDSRLRASIAAISPRAAAVVLDETVSAAEVARLLGEAS